jgi:type III secretory pathway component EscV
MEMAESLSSNANKILFEVFEFFYELAEYPQVKKIFNSRIKSLMFGLKELRSYIQKTEKSFKNLIKQSKRQSSIDFEDTISLSRF